MNRRVFVLGLGAVSLVGCATLPNEAVRQPAPDPGMLEAVYGMSNGPEGLTVRVASGGCTGRDSFAVYVDRTGRMPLVLLGRRRLDRCKSFGPARTDLLFTWAELGLAPGSAFKVLNPLEP